MFQISPTAAAFLAKKGWPLRVSVTGGGCAGFQYHFGIGEARKNDHVIQVNGATVLIDPRSDLFLKDSVLDMEKDDWSHRLVVRNPQAKTVCGCGESFGV